MPAPKGCRNSYTEPFPRWIREESLPTFRTIHIETERLLIRPFEWGDLRAFHGIVRQPEVMAFLPEEIMSYEEAEDILSWLIESYDVNTLQAIRKFTVATVLRDTEEVIGWVGLGPLEFEPAEIELYYGIARQHWDRGFATEAARAMLEYAFEVIGLHRIVAVVNPANVASVRVLEKIGMKTKGPVTGLHREHDFYENSVMFILVRDEWSRKGPQQPHGAPRRTTMMQ